MAVLWVSKAPTTPERVFDGIAQALDHGATERGLTRESLLRATSVFIYGTTRGTNAILTGATARTAFLTTEGHPDTLVLREGGKLNPFDFRHAYPAPYVPRRLTFEVRERIDSEGRVTVPLDEAALRDTRRDPELEVEAVAVCLLWSIVNPVHEERVGELLEEELPGVPFTLSHRLNPIIREYRRASSTAIDASLKPLMQRHLDEMARDLRAAGFGGELLVGTSFGGVLGVRDVAARPIYSVNSAPAMAPVAARVTRRQERNVIVCDMGGTSFDVSLVRDGYIKFTRETWLGAQFTGHMTGFSAVDIKNIGAGGGSIAWIDAGGLLRVGPQSAGAQPGPACYGRRDAGHGHRRRSRARLHRSRLLPRRAHAAVAGGPRGARTRGGAAARDGGRGRGARRAHDRERAHGRRDQGHHDQRGVRPARVADRGRRWRRGDDDRPDRRGAGLPARARAPHGGNASACGGLFSDVVTEFSISQRADTNRFDQAAVNAAWHSWASRSTSSSGGWTSRRGAQQGVLRGGALPVPGVGARGAAGGRPVRVRRPTWSHGRGLPPRPRARVRGQRAGAVHRVHLLEGPCHRRLPKPELTRTALDGAEAPTPATVRRAWFGAHGALDTDASG